MKKNKPGKKLRSVLRWILWVLLVQFALVNISAALYAHKLTHLYTAPPGEWQKPSRNIFTKTWRLFTGPRFYKHPLIRTPGFAYSTVILKTANGIPIEAWHSSPDTISKGTVILFHGLTSNKGEILDEAYEFRNQGYNIMLADVRNHGNSGGNATTIGYRESEEVKLAYDHILQSGEKNIFLWGTSMGAVEVIKAVSEYQLKPAGIIIEMPFLSLQSHLKGRARILGFPSQPFAFLTTFWIGIEKDFNGFGFQTTKYARNIKCPVLEQYGGKDELVLKNETDAIYNAIVSVNKKLVVYEDAVHESFFRKDPSTWRREVGAFLKAAKPTF
jgi:alpha-beta hydrolase superfamily lysophospholipase